jgi:uncharacterized damage-inducible protein DinB
MAHPLVEQLRFTRSEWRRGLEAVTLEEAGRRFEPINSIGWMVGHLAWHEQLYWLQRAQGQILIPEVERCAAGQTASTPPVGEMWAAWHTITQAAEAYLDTLTADVLLTHFEVDGKPHRESVGTFLYHIIYHYWYHLGEGLAVRQLLGHRDLPQFIGPIWETPYRPE